MKQAITLRKELMQETKERLKTSINEETMLIQMYQTVRELEHTINNLMIKLKNWFSCYLPEIYTTKTQQEALDIILSDSIEESKQKLNLKDSIGTINRTGYEQTIKFAKSIQTLIKTKELIEEQIEETTTKIAPSICNEISGKTLAQLLTKVGTIKRLANMPSSAIQLLGAEKALFRHLQNNRNNPPKYGLLAGEVQAKTPKERAKKTKQLSAKVTLAARKDYYGTNKT
ncbi:hypothetical protein CL622_02220 [archaeon]|nr:hypothetical protein [archaeon]